MPKFLKQSLGPYGRPPVMGAIFGFLLVLSAIVISSRSFLAFFSLGGLMIVVGGVVAVAFMSFEAADVKKALNGIRHMLEEPRMTHDNLHRDMTAIIYCAKLVKEKGMRNL